MALSATVLATLHASNEERTDEGLECLMRRDIAEAITFIGSDAEKATKWVVHNRTKVIWHLGDKPSIFVSKEDGDRFNGWYVTSYSIDGAGLNTRPVSVARGLTGVIGIQYIYEFFFGNDAENSEDIFDRNVAHVLRAMRRWGAVQGCPLIDIAAPKILTETGGVAVHWLDGRLTFDLCGL